MVRVLRILVAGCFFCAQAKADFMPPNDLHLQDSLDLESNLSEREFNEIIDKVEAYYDPIVYRHGGNLKVNRLWTNSTVNASASQSGSSWYVNMYGGLARRPEVTRDGFALVICHELGHHLAGFPYSNSWAANEGQSDYFATQSCARNIWKNETKVNAQFRQTIADTAKNLCDAQWQLREDQDLCYRVMAAGKSLADLLGGGVSVSFDSPDKTMVSRTNNAHPAGQCRLDTYMAGAVCLAAFDDEVIPWNQTEAADNSCMRQDGYSAGVRPLCWFKP